MKVRDLAQQAGVDKMTVSGIEAGKKAPHAQTVVRLRE
jgi:DNA-binding XRE family transcriptional regulator